MREQQNRSRRLHDRINLLDRLWFRHRFEPRVDHGPTALLVLGQNSLDIALQPTHFRPEQMNVNVLVTAEIHGFRHPDATPTGGR